jgi:hypothetical protein
VGDEVGSWIEVGERGEGGDSWEGGVQRGERGLGHDWSHLDCALKGERAESEVKARKRTRDENGFKSTFPLSVELCFLGDTLDN